MELTGTHLRYLLHMYEMSQREGEMRLTEIAKALHVKKASVARIVSVFREKQLVDQHRKGHDLPIRDRRRPRPSLLWHSSPLC